MKTNEAVYSAFQDYLYQIENMSISDRKNFYYYYTQLLRTVSYYAPEIKLGYSIRCLWRIFRSFCRKYHTNDKCWLWPFPNEDIFKEEFKQCVDIVLNNPNDWKYNEYFENLYRKGL